KTMGRSGLEGEEIEKAGQIIDLAAAGGRGAAYEVEDFPVLDAVIRNPFYPAFAVEIDGDDPLVDRLLHHEGDRPFGALGNVVERLAADVCARRRRSQQDQDFFLARANGDLLERPLGNNVALLVGFTEAATEREGEPQNRRGGGQNSPRTARPRRRLLA